MLQSLLKGKWTYCSFLNTPDLVGHDSNKAVASIFGEGVLEIDETNESTLRTVLDFGGGAAMDFFGEIIHGSGATPEVLIITGTGREVTNTAKWVYQYNGYIVPNWPQGVGQVPAIVGTVVRTIPRGNGVTGVVASFIIVKNLHARISNN